jgi:hypothetical protein
VEKIIALRLKPILSGIITSEQFGFLKGRLIHEAIGFAQEGIHTIKMQRKPVSVIKLDLSKAYDRVSWLYLRLLLLQIGFDLLVVNWVMSCVSSVQFAVLINGAGSPFF